MKKRRVYIIVLFVSVIGLFAIQYRFLNIGLNLAKVQFQRNIGKAAQVIKADLVTENQLTFLIGQAITLDDRYFTLSMDSIQDASRHFLNDFITHRLTENGIKKDFTFRLFTKDSTDYLSSAQPNNPNNELITYPIELEGYLPLLLDKQLILELQFKDLNSYFLFQLNGLTIPSLIFLIAIIIVIIWVFRSFYWQRNVITTTNEFINNLTHELKTPVFSIGLATKILEKQSNKEQKEVIALLKEQTERIKNLIDKVLELGSLESKKRYIELSLIDFIPNINELVVQFKRVADVEGFEFDYTIDIDQAMIKAEASHLENAIYNLLDNAKKYADNPKIQLKVRKEKEYLRMEVIDNGIGLSAKEKEMIFDKYYRVTKDNTHKVKGHGLGLSYVKEIIKRHRGRIKVTSEPNKGTIIAIEIPLNG